MAFDAARGEVVLFGGNAGSLLGDTWVYDGSDWTPKLVGGPSARDGHSMTYDPINNVVVLFGGRNSSGPQNDTWEWDGTNWGLRSSTGPNVRYDSAIAFDVSNSSIVMFGGTQNEISGMSDCWKWNITTKTWTSTTPGPSPRFGHSMVYDSSWNNILMFGGVNSSMLNNELYMFRSNPDNWTLLSPTANPSERYWAAAAFDVHDGYFLLYGGFTGGPNGEHWEYNGFTADWNAVMLLGDKPSARYSSAMVYDTNRRVFVLFGGYDGAYLADTWEF
jgi:hypothetical protein